MDHDAARRILAQKLEDLQRAGLRWLPVDRSIAPQPATPVPDTSSPSTSPRSETQPAMPRPKSSAASGRTGGGSAKQRGAPLQALREEVAGCTRCSELAATRTQTVFGVGNPRARLCLLGEAPGADEDRQGEPFVGRAGQLLNRILEACTLSRDDVYILNILKCRPPGNRNPHPQEADNCREYLERQLDLIRPEFICCLGAVAAQNLLHTTESIGKLRGRFHDHQGIRVIATYHPAYLLRNPAAKRHTWDDMKLLMQAMDIKIPSKKPS